MHESAPHAQEESRSDRVALAVTPSEKRAIRGVAAIHGTDECNLCRTMTIADIVAEFERVRVSAFEPAERSA